jgi:hypothetical protein
MKSYLVEVKRTSYITMTVEAGDKDEAEAKAWHEIEYGRADINDAHWELESIEEQS